MPAGVIRRAKALPLPPMLQFVFVDLSSIVCAVIPIYVARPFRCSKRCAAERDLEIEHQRTPTPEELSEKMEMTLEELQNWQARFQASRVKSLDEVYTDHSILFQDFTPSPEEATYQSQMRGILRKAISKLPEREARVLQLYYVAELNVYEVAAILDVTTGRISQIKRAAIERAHSLIMEQID